MKTKTNKEIIEGFREKFLQKGSDCTWKDYPVPEEFEEFLTQALEQKEREVREEIVRQIEERHNYVHQFLRTVCMGSVICETSAIIDDIKQMIKVKKSKQPKE